jgi:hypothetical protein
MDKPIDIAERIWREWWPTRRPETIADVSMVVAESLAIFRTEAKSTIDRLVRETKLTHEELVTHRHLQARRQFAAELLASPPFSDPKQECESAPEKWAVEAAEDFFTRLRSSTGTVTTKELASLITTHFTKERA